MTKITTASVVLFKTPEFLVSRIIECLIHSNVLHTIFIIDNSPGVSLYSLGAYKNVQYIKNINNGYGSAHNIAIKKAISFSDYHLILNPDIYFDSKILSILLEEMKQDPEIGLIMPKILYPDGTNQYLCKLIPTPVDLFLRRFKIPFLGSYANRRNFKYELRFTEYQTEMNVPTLSGCFLLANMNAIKSVGMFDERFFMYAEDVDFTRRVHRKFKTVFYPGAEVFHEHAKSSYKNFRMLLFHALSVVKYFNKWGWFWDVDRVELNRKFLVTFKKHNEDC